MKTITLLFIFLLFLPALLLGQNKKIDSLQKVIATTKIDTVKARTLCRLCGVLEDERKPEDAQKYLDEGMALSKKINDLLSITICQYKAGNLQMYAFGDYDKAITIYQQVVKISLQINNDLYLGYAYYSIGLCYLYKEDLAKALQYTKNYLQIAQRMNKRVYIAEAYRGLGQIYQKKGNYSQALKEFNKSIEVYKSLGDSAYIANVLVGLGSVYYFMGNYPKALGAFNRGLIIGEKLKDVGITANHTNNIGNIYHHIEDYASAIKYYEKSLALSQSVKNEQLIAYCYNNLAGSYQGLKQKQIARDYYLKSLELKEKLGNISDILVTLINVAKTSMVLKNYSDSEKYFLRASALMDSVSIPENKTYFLYSYSTFLLETGKFAQAQKTAYQALEIAKEIGHLEFIAQAAFSSCRADSALGDYKSAFEHHKLYKQYSDSLNNEDKAKEFGKIESRYEFEKQTEAEKRAAQEKAKIEAQAQQRRNNLQYLTIFAGIIGLFTGLLFMGKLQIPFKVMEIVIFAGLLITFEFLLILFDPFFDKYSGGIPLYKLAFNTLVAFGFAPLHSFLEATLRKKLVNKA